MLEVLLVDDEQLLLESLEIILTMNQIHVIGMAHDGKEALAILKNKSCQMALVDLNMKGMGGIELIHALKQEYPEMKILILTTFYEDTHITNAISAGADGYLLKGSGKDAILGAISSIMGGQNVIDHKVMQRMAMLIKKNHDAANRNGLPDGKRLPDGGSLPDEPHLSYESRLSDMTDREKEISSLLIQGLNNRQIADALYISEGTVKNYVSSIYDKTGIHDRSKFIVAMKE